MCFFHFFSLSRRINSLSCQPANRIVIVSGSGEKREKELGTLDGMSSASAYCCSRKNLWGLGLQ